MKMQNEVRAPRGGRIIEVSVAPGQAVATGVPLLRLE
jgi:biotin carboxyl carrier protein